MRATGRHALLLALVAVLAGCRREAGDDRSERGPPATDDARAAATPSDATAASPTPPPPPTLLSLRREQSGWRFDLDAAIGVDSTRVEVLVRAPTVGAAPRRLHLQLDGALTEAFATDLDADAAPELLLWARASGSSAEGDIRGWRFDASGDTAPIALPALDDAAAIGWRGRDQFGIQGDRLVRSFPVYRDEDDNANPSAGFVRVVRYRLDADGLRDAEATLEPMDGTPQADVLAR